MTRVLVVDDSRFAGKIMCKLLGEHGLECEHVDSVAAVFGFHGQPSKLREIKPDVILVDIVMPEMDGLDVLRKLRAMPAMAEIPIIMLSSAADERNVTEALQLGADGFLSKPVQSERLLQELVRAARKAPNGPLAQTLAAHMKRSGGADDEWQAGPANLNDLVDILDGDMDMVKELIGVFLEDCPGQLESMDRALAGGDAEGLRAAAHRFKGAVGNFGAPKIIQMAARLETLAAQGELQAAAPALQELKSAATDMAEAMTAWVSARAD